MTMRLDLEIIMLCKISQKIITLFKIKIYLICITCTKISAIEKYFSNIFFRIQLFSVEGVTLSCLEQKSREKLWSFALKKAIQIVLMAKGYKFKKDIFTLNWIYRYDHIFE